MCTCASNGSEALGKTRDEDFAVIIVDISMPGMDGIEFYKQLKVEDPEMAKKVVFVSGHLEDSNYSFIVKERRPCLGKPFDKKEFYRIIDYVVNP